MLFPDLGQGEGISWRDWWQQGLGGLFLVPLWH